MVMTVTFGVLPREFPIPAGRHFPLLTRISLGTDKEVCDLDRGIGARGAEKLIYAGHDFLDVGITLGGSFVP